MTKPRIDIDSYLRLTELADYIVPFCLRVVCDLRLADLLVDGARPVGELAELTGSHGPSLHRVLRALACKGIFTETEPGWFALTPLAEPLRSDHPFSIAECFPLMPPDIDSWGRMGHTLATGQVTFDHLHGTGYYDWFTDPRRAVDAERFELSSESVNPFVLRTVLPAHPWGDYRTLVDVGGGYGSFALGILRRHRQLEVTVLDQPHVVAAGQRRQREEPDADRLRFVAGDFFDAVPPGADAYLLKTILHDWADERAARILAAVRAAMRPDSTLLVLESVRTPGDGTDVGRVMDVKAMVLFGGHTRTEAELATLFAGAGLELTGLRHTPTMSLIQARPV